MTDSVSEVQVVGFHDTRVFCLLRGHIHSHRACLQKTLKLAGKTSASVVSGLSHVSDSRIIPGFVVWSRLQNSVLFWSQVLEVKYQCPQCLVCLYWCCGHVGGGQVAGKDAE